MKAFMITLILFVLIIISIVLIVFFYKRKDKETYNSHVIPKIINFVWLGTKDFSKYNNNIEDFRKINNDFEIRIWRDDDANDLLDTYLPEFKDFFNSLPRIICKCDFIRYCIIYITGGFYFDMDFHPVNNLSPLTDDNNFILMLEPEEHTKELMLNNAFASYPRNQFFYDLLKQIVVNVKTTEYSKDDSMYVLSTTGPRALYNFWKSHPNRPKLMSNCIFGAYMDKQKITKRCEGSEEDIYAYTLWNEGTNWGE